MLYYFASRYSNHPLMRECRDQLEAAIPGAKVVAHWIDCHNEELEQSYTPEALNADPEGCWRRGRADLQDLLLADALVSFTGAGGKGGRHIEHGFAMAMNHFFGAPRIVIVGARENVFHCDPEVEVYATFAEFLAAEVDRAIDADYEVDRG